MGGTTFKQKLNPLFVYHFHRCVGNNRKTVQACGGVCGTGGGFGSGSDGWGGDEDACNNERMDWSNEEEKKRKKV